MDRTLQCDQKPNWTAIISNLDILIAQNNPEVTEKSPQVAVGASVIFLGATILCVAIMLNDPDTLE